MLRYTEQVRVVVAVRTKSSDTPRRSEPHDDRSEHKRAQRWWSKLNMYASQRVEQKLVATSSQCRYYITQTKVHISTSRNYKSCLQVRS